MYIYSFIFFFDFRVQIFEEIDSCSWTLLIQPHCILIPIFILQVPTDLLYSDIVSLFDSHLFSYYIGLATDVHFLLLVSHLSQASLVLVFLTL